MRIYANVSSLGRSIYEVRQVEVNPNSKMMTILCEDGEFRYLSLKNVSGLTINGMMKKLATEGHLTIDACFYLDYDRAVKNAPGGINWMN